MADDVQETETQIQDFILSRELAEVYLLIDHISACQDKELPSIDKDKVFSDSERPWIEQICEIAWPPEPSSRGKKDARNAAKLIRAKDALNKAAAPATGGSIAFTVMVAGDAGSWRDSDGEPWPLRVLRPVTGPRAPKATEAGNGDGGGPPANPEPPSRNSLAALAYPALAGSARSYRWMLYVLLGFLVLWLLLTCFLSWDVATGNSLLNRVTALDAQVTTLTGAVHAPSSGQNSGAVQGKTVEQLSGDLQRTVQLRATATGNLAHWLDAQGWIRGALRYLMGGRLEESTVSVQTGAPNTGRETNAEWAAALLGVLASNILPIFYGLLGAGAAVVRLVSQKMRDSVLAPRDIWLAYVQLALGAVIGACIGLFVNSEGDAATTQGGLLGSVPLSGSALCFVAGFGVEGVFQGLESLIRRVFNLETPQAPST